MFCAFIKYKGLEDGFKVEDCGYGAEWARTRAIAHFFHKHPELDKLGTSIPSFRADRALADGLLIVLLAL